MMRMARAVKERFRNTVFAFLAMNENLRRFLDITTLRVRGLRP
jgi:hypothetical protein